MLDIAAVRMEAAVRMDASEKFRLKRACRLAMQLRNADTAAGTLAMDRLIDVHGGDARAWFNFFIARDAVVHLDPNYKP